MSVIDSDAVSTKDGVLMKETEDTSSQEFPSDTSSSDVTSLIDLSTDDLTKSEEMSATILTKSQDLFSIEPEDGISGEFQQNSTGGCIEMPLVGLNDTPKEDVQDIMSADTTDDIASTELKESPAAPLIEMSLVKSQEMLSVEVKEVSAVKDVLSENVWSDQVSSVEEVLSAEELLSVEFEDNSSTKVEDMSEEETMKDQSPTVTNIVSATGEGSGHKILGVEMAPVNIPLHRRMETFMVLQTYTMFLYVGFSAIILSVVLLFTDYYWLSFIMYAVMIYDRHTPHTGGRSWDWFRRLNMWKHLANYYPVRLYKTADLDPNNNYLLGFHPHGVIVCGGFVNFCTEATGFSELFPGITPHLMSLAGFFQYPFGREYLLATGLCAASSQSFDALLGKSVSGTAAIIVVGGAVEVLEAYPNHYSVYLSRRKGFVRKAIQNGAHLVPVYSFGETDVYDQYIMAEGSWKRALQVKVNQLVGIPPIIFKGRGIFNYTLGILPYRRPINTVVGRPIPLKLNPHPSKEEIDRVHLQYMDSLTALFNEYKVQFGLSEDEQLEII